MLPELSAAETRPVGLARGLSRVSDYGAQCSKIISVSEHVRDLHGLFVTESCLKSFSSVVLDNLQWNERNEKPVRKATRLVDVEEDPAPPNLPKHVDGVAIRGIKALVTRG